MKHRLAQFLVCLALSGVAAAAGAVGFTYNGRLSDSAGKPVQGPVDLRIAFFTDPQGGHPIVSVTDGLTGIPLDDGVFQIVVELSPSDYNEVFSDVAKAVYVEITDLTNAPDHPYQRHSVSILPYAARIPVDGKTVRFDSEGLLTAGPASMPGANQFLTKDSGGNFIWATPSVSTEQSSQGSAAGTGSAISFDAGQISSGSVAITNGGTGATSAAEARASLGAAQAGANSDITSLSGLSTPLSLAQGGTGGASALAARSSLGAAASGANSDITSLTSGNIGIGTTAATSPLTVAGVIESTQGGVKFPDGSMLQTARTSVSTLTSSYTLTAADQGRFFSVVGSVLVTLPLASAVGAGFSVRLKNMGSAQVSIQSHPSETIDYLSSKYYLPRTRDLVDLLVDASLKWVVAGREGTAGFGPLCGGAGDSCYSNAAAIAAGYAVTPTGKLLAYVFANGASGFQVWRESGGMRVLRANGLDQWAAALKASGSGWSGMFFEDSNLGTLATKLAGRVCPPVVFISDNDKMAPGHCLYYDSGNTPLAFSGPGSSQMILGSIGRSTMPTDVWYAGNLNTCAAKGMRMPTLFETTAADPGVNTPTTDGLPVFAGTAGVPSDGAATWTATKFTGSVNEAWVWNGSAAGCTGGICALTVPNSVRCVLP